MRSLTRLSLCLLACLLAAGPAAAVVRPQHTTELDPLQKADSAFYPGGREVLAYDAVTNLVTPRDGWASYAAEAGDRVKLYFDAATGEAALVQGAPIPFIPGSGNDLRLDDLAAIVGGPVTAVDAAVVGAVADDFVDRHIGLLGVPRFELARRGAERVTENLWVVTYEHVINGVTVRDSRLTLVIGHGNLILWGSEQIFPLAPGALGSPSTSAVAAEASLADYVGWDARRDTVLQAPSLVFLPERSGFGKLDAGASGKRHRLVWETAFHRAGVLGTWVAHIDAASGEVLQFGDANRYHWIKGGIYPLTWTDAEESRPLGLVNLTPGGFSSIEGIYTNPGATVTGDFDGELVEIADQCSGAGFPSVDSDVDGNIDFGTGPPNPNGDADCTNNGIGNSAGAHNTHAARSAYYHITRFKDKGRSWLPTNTWLDSQHEVRVNINNVCNAYWSPGGGYNGFFQEGFYGALHCYNTGEIAAIFLHEVGHGIDDNDAQGGADGGTGETYADVTAMLDLHDSCIGHDFWTQQCTGYGFPCTNCSGVRDQDYAAHVDGAANPVTTPFTPANFTATCPGAFFGAGPCNKEVHCEAYPAGGAVYDLATRKLDGPYDSDTAWLITERTFTLAMQSATAMFNCNSTTFASDGCAATSWFMTFLAADDDDGNLANGTPHAAEIFAAFDDHAVACGSSGDPENQNSSACSSLATPTLSASPGAGGSVDLSWGSVANASGYTVLKNHGHCDRGFLHAATVTAPAVSYNDTDVADGQLYAYRLVALDDSGIIADNSCYSDMSSCIQITAGADVIFTDGFESGDTSMWSVTVP